MAAPTDSELLDALRTALNRIVGGAAEYTVNGRTYKSHDIDKLMELIKYYEGRVERNATTGSPVFALGSFRSAT